MTKLYSGNQKNYNRQLATAYAAYMIVSSYYKKCVVKNTYEEKHLFLHYKELPEIQQIAAESNVLQQMEALSKNLTDTLRNMYCEVNFTKDDSDYIISFTTGGFESLKVQITPHNHVFLYLQ